MGFLLPILQSIGAWLLQSLLTEVKEAWADKEIKEFAEIAVEYAEDKFTGNVVKAKVAEERLTHDLSLIGKSLSKKVVTVVIEKAVQRYIK